MLVGRERLERAVVGEVVLANLEVRVGEESALRTGLDEVGQRFQATRGVSGGQQHRAELELGFVRPRKPGVFGEDLPVHRNRLRGPHAARRGIFWREGAPIARGGDTGVPTCLPLLRLVAVERLPPIVQQPGEAEEDLRTSVALCTLERPAQADLFGLGVGPRVSRNGLGLRLCGCTAKHQEHSDQPRLGQRSEHSRAGYIQRG